MFMSQHKRPCLDPNSHVAPTVDVHFQNNDEATSTDIRTHASRLKTKLTTREPTWKGKLLMRTTRETTMDFILYDVLNRKIIKQRLCEFYPDKMIQIGDTFAIIESDQTLVYLLDMELNAKKVYEDERILCLTLLSNNTIAIGTQEKIVVVDENWQEIHTIPTENVVDIAQLKDGSLACAHYTEDVLHLTVLNKHYKELQSYPLSEVDGCDIVVELPSGLICSFGDEGSVTTDRNTEESECTEFCDHIFVLQSGMHLVSEGLEVKFYSGTTLVHETKQYPLSNTWRGAVAEISPGKVAWESNHSLICYDVVKGEIVEGYPKPLNEMITNKAVSVRWFMME